MFKKIKFYVILILLYKVEIMVNLDIRLKAVYDMVGKSESVLDVGSDHGYLPIQLFKNNMIKFY